jgi:hypothetical protein
VPLLALFGEKMLKSWALFWLFPEARERKGIDQCLQAKHWSRRHRRVEPKRCYSEPRWVSFGWQWYGACVWVRDGEECGNLHRETLSFPKRSRMVKECSYYQSLLRRGVNDWFTWGSQEEACSGEVPGKAGELVCSEERRPGTDCWRKPLLVVAVSICDTLEEVRIENWEDEILRRWEYMTVEEGLV